MSTFETFYRLVAREKRLKRIFRTMLPEAIAIPVRTDLTIFVDPLDVRGPSFHLSREFFRPSIALDGYEPKERKFIHSAFRRRNGRGVFLDIGANIGLYSLPLAREFPNVTIYAFEPHPRNIGCLENSINVNELKNIRLQPFGLSKESDRKSLFLDETDSGGHSLIESNMWNNKSKSKSIEIELRSLDQWANELPIQQLDVVKIDVQGVEPDVFDGGMNTLKKFKPDILIEIQFEGLLNRGEVLQQLLEINPNYQFRNMEDEIWRPISKLRDDIQRRANDGYLISDYFFSSQPS